MLAWSKAQIIPPLLIATKSRNQATRLTFASESSHLMPCLCVCASMSIVDLLQIAALSSTNSQLQLVFFAGKTLAVASTVSSKWYVSQSKRTVRLYLSEYAFCYRLPSWMKSILMPCLLAHFAVVALLYSQRIAIGVPPHSMIWSNDRIQLNPNWSNTSNG